MKNYIYNLAKKIIVKRIVHGENRLTEQYLLDKGWIKEDGFYIEPNIKDRDRISIRFDEPNYVYTVWHSSARTFIACETSIEWFEMYYLLAHPDNGRYKIAGI